MHNSITAGWTKTRFSETKSMRTASWDGQNHFPYVNYIHRKFYSQFSKYLTSMINSRPKSYLLHIFYKAAFLYHFSSSLVFCSRCKSNGTGNPSRIYLVSFYPASSLKEIWAAYFSSILSSQKLCKVDRVERR